jgi:hypothetical protein
MMVEAQAEKVLLQCLQKAIDPTTQDYLQKAIQNLRGGGVYFFFSRENICDAFFYFFLKETAPQILEISFFRGGLGPASDFFKRLT